MPETDQIALDVGGRILEGVANPSLSSQIHHHPGLLFGEQSHQCRAILQGQGLETPGARGSRRFHARQPGTFERWVVIGVEIVDPHHPLAAFEQTQGQSRTDETGGSCDQDGARCGSAISTHGWPSPTRQSCNPASSTSAGLTTERASNTQAG